MNSWKMPPIAKVYEALGAIADERLKATGDTTMIVTSSSGDKHYLVEWDPNFKWISSNDNASFWQGYIGYPIIATLLQLGRISFSKEVAAKLKGVEWKKVNTKHKNNYSSAIHEVLEDARSRGIVVDDIEVECEQILNALLKLEIGKPEKKRRPPKKTSGSQDNLFST